MLKKTTDLEKRYIPNIQYTPTLEKRMAIHRLYTALEIALRHSHGPRVANCLGGRIFQYIPPLGSVLFQGCFPYACASFKTWNSSLYFQQTAESQSCIQLCKLQRSHRIQNIIRYLLAKIDICLEGKRMKLFSG